MSGFFAKIAAFFTAIAVAFGGWLCSFKAVIPEGKSTDELLSTETVFKHRELADEIYAVNAGRAGDGGLDTLVCLQGLANRDKARLYIIYDNTYKSYLDDIEASGKKVIYKDADGMDWSLTSIINELKGFITDGGYTLYRESEFAQGLNMACNLATAKGWLAFREDKAQLAEDCGLTLKADLSKADYDYAFQKSFFEEYRDAFGANCVVHVKQAVNGLRDYAIQQGAFICYSESNTAGNSFLKGILNEMPDNTIVLGWGETEKHFVSFLSGLGCSIVPADHSRNNSILSAFNAGELKQKRGTGALPSDPTKHYAAIVFSDGDNSQWVQGGFREYYNKLNKYNDFTMTWTFPPLQQEFCSDTVKRAYAAGDEKNCIISGISGAAYINPSKYKESCLDGYADITAAAMLRSDMRVITILDDKPSAFKQADFERRFGYFSRYDSISGGIVMLDPGRYAAGGGKVWFSDDKPFVSVRLSLWHPDGEGADVSKEWIKEQADVLNSFSADIDSIDGYSVINVHPWTISVENLAYFVSLLDDDVELVTAETLIDMIAKNTEHIDAAPKN